jgi:hypothetical protein
MALGPLIGIPGLDDELQMLAVDACDRFAERIRLDRDHIPDVAGLDPAYALAAPDGRAGHGRGGGQDLFGGQSGAAEQLQLARIAAVRLKSHPSVAATRDRDPCLRSQLHRPAIGVSQPFDLFA